MNKKVHEILGYLDLEDVAHTTVSGLPFGTQKRVELARALAADPKILLLDEPAGGLNHEEVHVLGDLIRKHPRRAQRSPCCWSSITWGS